MNFEDMTYPEIEEKQKSTKTVLIPFSILEEHGPHLPVSTDYDRALYVCSKAAEKTNVFCLPSIIGGICNKNYAYPGTISLSSETVTNIIKDTCKSLKDTGFERIIFVSGHGGSAHPNAINKALDELADKNISFHKVSGLMDEELNSLIETENDQHAGEKETSDMLVIKPGLVKMDKAVASFPKTHPPSDSPKIEFKKANPSGVFGDPTKATKEKGEKRLNNAIGNLVKVIEEMEAVQNMDEISSKLKAKLKKAKVIM